MKFNILLFLASIFAFSLAAQENMLPHYPTGDEEKAWREYLEIQGTTRRVPLAPSGPVRTMAEWEPIQALIITWAGQNTILREIVRHSVKECKVLIITTNVAGVTTQLTDAGIPLDSVQFVNIPFNSIWVRDYGPWTVYKNDVDSLFLIDWIYNRPRAQDDITPTGIAQHLNLPIFEAILDPEDLVHTGGNHLPDGMGTAFSSMLVLEENNDKTESEIDSIAKKYLGVNQYIKFPTLPYDGIHHLDMHMRIIDEETIIFGEYPNGVADGPQINANIAYLLEEFRTSFGNPFRIIRIPMAPENDRYPDQGGDYRTYTNSIFVNKTILVPTYEEKYDTTALRIYRENLPGYNVVGINCNSIIPSLGALHCITKLVGSQEPLLIAHPRLRDSDDAEKEYPVQAIIKHITGIEEATVYYRIGHDSVYSFVPMILEDTSLHLWSAVIPPHPSGTEIQYYIHARATNAKEQVRPIVAPTGYFNFWIHGEPVNQPPSVSINYPEDGAVFTTEEGVIGIGIEAFDTDGEIMEITVYVDGDSIASLDTLPYTYDWLIPGEGDYEIWVRATDNDGGLSFSDVVNVTIETTTGTKDSDAQALELFPNPVTDILWIKNNTIDINNVTVTNLFGQQVLLSTLQEGNAYGYDFSQLPSGIYFIQASVNGVPRSERVIKL